MHAIRRILQSNCIMIDSKYRFVQKIIFHDIDIEEKLFDIFFTLKKTRTQILNVTRF